MIETALDRLPDSLPDSRTLNVCGCGRRVRAWVRAAGARVGTGSGCGSKLPNTPNQYNTYSIHVSSLRV